MSAYDPLNSAHHSPYQENFYNDSTGYIPQRQGYAKKKGVSKWVTIGLPVFILVLAGAGVGIYFGTRAKSQASSAAASSPTNPQAAKSALGRFATATNSEFMRPLYPATTNSAAFSTPTFATSNSPAWPQDPYQFSSKPAPTTVRPDRPRLIAPAYKWQALPGLIAQDAYLKGWNDTIFGNATAYYSMNPVTYFMDGPSGILDNAREIKERIKAFSYVYRMTNDTKWVDRTLSELRNSASDGWGAAGDTKWNPKHFLDTAELSAAYGIAYDWLYDILTEAEKTEIRGYLVTFGLNQGLIAYKNLAADGYTGWWTANSTNGNWNCVCNSGLTLGSLAILGDDTTGTASKLLSMTVGNALAACAQAPSTDGTWSETANYWYFGTTGHAEMSASLMSATGSDYGLLNSNPHFKDTGYFHMHVYGSTSLFNYGDHGPNKFSTTANSMIFYGSQYNRPQFTLFQRDQSDAAEPWSMFWYDPSIEGAFWDNTPLDHFFDDGLDQWTAMRSSWTDINALYVGAKAGKLQGHQTHNDLDCGDFVIDALGTRWAGELGSGDYRSTNYFLSDAQDATRWLYYRKRTEGQNTILVNGENQIVTAAPTVQHGTSGSKQGSSTVLTLDSSSIAWWTADLSSAYNTSHNTNFKRGVRTINARKQVLIQDDITTSAAFEWRMHTNATVNVDSSGTSATLSLDGQQLIVMMPSAPSGAKFTSGPTERAPNDPPLPTGQWDADQPNPGVSVLKIALPAGTYNLQVLFNPQWPGMTSSDFKTTFPMVPVTQWSTNSHP